MKEYLVLRGGRVVAPGRHDLRDARAAAHAELMSRPNATITIVKIEEVHRHHRSQRHETPYLHRNPEVAAQILALLEGREGGMSARELAETLGYKNGRALKMTLQTLHERRQVHGEMKSSAYMKWFPQTRRRGEE